MDPLHDRYTVVAIEIAILLVGNMVNNMVWSFMFMPLSLQKQHKLYKHMLWKVKVCCLRVPEKKAILMEIIDHGKGSLFHVTINLSFLVMQPTIPAIHLLRHMNSSINDSERTSM